MYLCYIDESGTSTVPGNTSHFVLAGISVPIWHWQDCDREIRVVTRKFGIEHAELHTAWMLRPYLEQRKIKNFDSLNSESRRFQVDRYRRAELLRLQKTSGTVGVYRQTKKNYKKTEAYVHLTYAERQQCISEVAHCVSEWGFARVFAECIDKVHFDPGRAPATVDEQAFEQVVSRFERFLQLVGTPGDRQNFGLLIHDNNETVARKHTELMKQFHRAGTLWTELKNKFETPLFVDSELTRMVQIADLCSYAMRRYLENQETELFHLIFERADRKDGLVVGVRHFTNPTCACLICGAHRKH